MDFTKRQYDRLFMTLKEKSSVYFKDGHSVHTPKDLVEELIGKIPNVKKAEKILVLNIEFAVSLSYIKHVDKSNIWVWAHCKEVEFLIKDWGFNTYTKDILGSESSMKFDVVIGNPPYQPPINKQKKEDNIGSGNKIWHKFIDVAFNVLKKDGIIAMITPANYRLGSFTRSVINKVQEKMWKYKFIEIMSANSYFGSNLGNLLVVDYWILDTSKINDFDEVFKKVKYFPLKGDEKRILDFFKEAVSSSNDESFIINIKENRSYDYDCIRSVSRGDSVHIYKHFNTWAQYKKGLFDWYSEKTEGFNIKKVIITTSVGLSDTSDNKLSFFDKNGEFGCGHAALAYSVNSDKEGEQLTNFLNNSKICKLLYDEGNTGKGFGVPIGLYSKLPKSYVERFNNGEDL